MRVVNRQTKTIRHVYNGLADAWASQLWMSDGGLNRRDGVMNIDRNDLRLVDLTIGPFAFNKLTDIKRGEL